MSRDGRRNRRANPFPLPPPKRPSDGAHTRRYNGNGYAEGESRGTLVSALAKAHRWQEQLELGEFGSLEDLAAASGVDRTYVGRILRLTSLAPEIVERILVGDEQAGTSLSKLRTDLPNLWSEQSWT